MVSEEDYKQQERAQTLKIVASLASILVAALTIHGIVFMPMILTEARDQTQKMIEAHEAHPHPGAVTREEVALIRQLIDSHNKAISREVRELKSAIKKLK